MNVTPPISGTSDHSRAGGGPIDLGGGGRNGEAELLRALWGLCAFTQFDAWNGARHRRSAADLDAIARSAFR
jgi:hypothetical protein